MLGGRTLDLVPGEVVEFDTRTPHVIANRTDEPLELLGLFGPQASGCTSRSGR